MTKLDPFLLSPVLSERPWGGTRLAQFGKHLPDGVPIGESWEVADLPDGVASGIPDPRSRVAGGPHVGLSLADLITSHGDDLMGEAEPTPEGRFPLLVKLIDANEPLSIQVHPPADYVATHPDARLKTESWYVIEAAHDAELFIDFADGIADEQIGGAVGSPALVPLIRRRSVSAGMFQHVPAGLVHSIGAGVLLAEVQTPSDTTFRMYDWAVELGRAPREMHIEQALGSIRRSPEEAFDLAAFPGPGARDLISCGHYWMREHRLAGGLIGLRPTGGPTILMIVAGAVDVDGLGVGRGGTAMIPASSTPAVTASPGTTVLEVGLVP